ncbi:MAG: response regulator [Desulfovibrionaceae bacterium]
MRVLVVEDEFLSRKVLKSFLAPFFDVDVVVNGVEAVEAFRLALADHHPYELVLMDIMMPEMNGIEALKAIRGIEQERGLQPAHCLMITALSDPKTVITSFHEGGASGYLVKPVDKRKLYSELEKLELISR